MIWALLSGRGGDDALVLAAADACSGELRRFNLRYNFWRELPNSLTGASLRTVKSGGTFSPPWPDLIIAAGRRSPPVARWIKQKSGGKAKLVHIGRPRAPLDWFDLILTTPQYGLADAPNVHRMSLPLVSSRPVAKEKTHVLAVLGGDSWSARLSDETIDQIAAISRTAAEKMQIPLYAATSPRTTAAQAARFEAALGEDAQIHVWQKSDTDSPYADWLANAAEIVISGDSISILSDAIMTDRPVAVVPVPEPLWLRAAEAIGGKPWLRRGGNLELFAPPPNLPAIWEHLAAHGLAKTDDRGVIRVEGARAAILVEHKVAISRLKCLAVE